MATKSKKRCRRRSLASLFGQAEGALARGHVKQALKDAKVCHRQQPSEKTHQLLQRAYLARAQELRRFGLRDESRAAMENLLELGVTEPSVQEELPELLVALGLFDRGEGGLEASSEEVDSPLLSAAADHAVLRPREAPASMPGIRQGASRVRAGLAALEAGNESEALAALREVARGSPFADWKYFVRGLAAYYRQDATEMRANWERLDPDRFAARIAAHLRALAEPASNGQGDPPPTGLVCRLAGGVLSGPVLSCLLRLQADVAAGRWKEALRELKRSRKIFDGFDPTLLQRIGQAVYSSLVRRGKDCWLAELTALISPPAIDPHWNRGRAMTCERSCEADMDQLEGHWRRYLDDLAELPCLTPEERSLAQALVWLRLGRRYVHESKASLTFFRSAEQRNGQMRARAVRCFAEGIKRAPGLQAAHEALAAAHLAWEQPDEAAGAYRRLLEHFPEDLEALRFLAVFHQQRDEPFEAREYAFRARRLKPLDGTIDELIRGIHIASARHYALAKQWDQGRAELEAAERITPKDAEPYQLLVCRAALEFKAGELGLGQRLVERARHCCLEPGNGAGNSTPVLLYLTIQAIRYALPKAIAAEFEHQWVTALKGRCHHRAAGRMGKILTAYVATKTAYRGRAEHVGRLLGYLWRCSRVKWQADDLRQVCEFLGAVSRDDELYDDFVDPDGLLEKFARKGCKAFPKYPYFHCLTGELEIRRGPRDCNRSYAYECFQRALELGKQPGAAEDAEVVEGAKRGLTFLGEVGLETDTTSAGLPLPSFLDDEELFGDDAGEFYLDEDEDLFDLSPERMREIFEKVCASMGFDPEEVLDRAAEGMPLPVPLPAGNAGSRTKRKKKRKKRR